MTPINDISTHVQSRYIHNRPFRQLTPCSPYRWLLRFYKKCLGRFIFLFNRFLFWIADYFDQGNIYKLNEKTVAQKIWKIKCPFFGGNSFAAYRSIFQSQYVCTTFEPAKNRWKTVSLEFQCARNTFYSIFLNPLFTYP